MSTTLFLILRVQSQGTGHVHSVTLYHIIRKLFAGRIVFWSYSNSETLPEKLIVSELQVELPCSQELPPPRSTPSYFIF